MNLLIATPCFGGLLTSAYFLSCLQLSDWLNNGKIAHAFYTLDNESLIPRGRNVCAQYALDNDFDKILFIDADIEFTVQDVARLLDSEAKIVGGTYPWKQYPLILNGNALETDHELFGVSRDQEALKKLGQARGNVKGEVEMRHIPTGFMLIDTLVLNAMTTDRPAYHTKDPTTGEGHAVHDFFPIGVRNGVYESEDWAFCSNARKLGFKIYLNTNVIVTHIGSHHFKVDPKPQTDLSSKRVT